MNTAIIQTTRIRRNATRQIKRIADAITEVRVYSLDNGFSGKPYAPEDIWGVQQAGGVYEWLLRETRTPSRRCGILYGNGGGVYTLHIHGNLWFRLWTN